MGLRQARQATLAFAAATLVSGLAATSAGVVAHTLARPRTAAHSAAPATQSLDAAMREMQRRDALLARLIAQAAGDPAEATALAPPVGPGLSPGRRLATIGATQDRLLAAADSFGRTRADHLRQAFRLAGVDPHAAGTPVIEAKDPRAIAAVLDVDRGFADRLRKAAADIAAMHRLDAAASAVPLARPAASGAQSSGYGPRLDPFTRAPNFHPGLDIAGPAMTPVLATAAGVVVFAGPKGGYGNLVEIDHGNGFFTRYGHLRTIAVQRGQRLALGQAVGGMGSTGHSTGDHVHYEIWRDGRAQDPQRYLNAGVVARGAG